MGKLWATAGGWWSGAARRDFIVLVLDRGLRLCFGLILAGLIGRHLGAEAFGWLSYAGATAAIAAAAAQLGLDTVLVREIVRHPEREQELVGAAMALRLIAGLVAAAGLWVLVPFISGDIPAERNLVRILALCTLAPAFAVPALWFQAKTQSRMAVRANLVGFGIVSAVRLWLLAGEAPVAAFAWTSLVEIGVNAVCLWGAFHRAAGRVRLRALREFGVPLLRGAWPLAITAIAGIVYLRVDQVILRWLGGADAVGVYAVATRLSETAYGIPLLLATSVAAGLNVVQPSTAHFDRAVKEYFQASSALGYALVIPAIVVAPWVLGLLFGAEFSEAGAVARVHLVTVVFVCMTFARGRVLVALGKTGFVMFAALLGCVFNVGLNLILIPAWGLMGAAVAAVSSHAVAAIGVTLLYRPTRELGIIQLKALMSPRVLWRD